MKYADNFANWKLVKQVSELAKTFKLKVFSKNPCGCLTEETEVLTSEGLKLISSLKDGDLVWAYNDTLNTYAFKKIYGFYSIVSDTLYSISTAKTLIRVTGNHPFLTNNGWKRADELLLSDSLFTENNLYVAVFGKDISSQVRRSI